MKLYDIVGGKVVIHPDLLGLPPIKELWESMEDKALANDYISYIILRNRHDSPYVQSYDEDVVEEVVKQHIFKDKYYKLPAEVLTCEHKFNELFDTRLLKALRAALKRLDRVSDFYQNDESEMDDKRAKESLQGIAALDKVIQSINGLIIAVKNEDQERGSKVRGGGKMNLFELPE